MTVKKVTDHLGNKFESYAEMFRFHNVNYNTATWRLKHGMPIKDVLNPSNIACIRAKDHLGNEYPSISAMFRAYKINPTTGFQKLNKLSIEEILTDPHERKPFTNAIKCIDFKGKQFNSIRDMCKHYNIPLSTFYTRYKACHWSLKDSLTKAPRQKGFTDHLGNKFKNVTEMCEFWEIPHSRFCDRYFTYKWSIKDSLTKPLQK